VLQQVRAGLVAEPVGVFMLGCRVCVIGHDSSFSVNLVFGGIVPYEGVGGLSIAYLMR
jgi:hypothetical protein